MSKITFIVTGHCMKRYPDNTTYLEHTIKSFEKIKNFNKSRVIIALDGNPREDLNEKYEIYKNKIRQFILDKENYEMICHNKHLNLAGNVYETLKLVKTKYIFLIQQDLSFIEEFDLNSILEDLDKMPEIKHLRFNDTVNKRIKGRNDDLVEFGKYKIEANNIYTSVPIFSDRNHISKLEYYTDFIFKDGILEKLKIGHIHVLEWNILAKDPIHRHDEFGTYIYGDINYKPMIIHYKAGRIRDIKI